MTGNGPGPVRARGELGRFVPGPGQRELAKRAGERSGEVRRASKPLRPIAEQGYRAAIEALTGELQRLVELWKAGTRLESTARKLVLVASELAKHTKHVLPLTVQADILHSLAIPALPPEVAAELRALAPSREELAALPAPDTGDT